MDKKLSPAFLQDHPGLGSLGNVEMPRLKLLQASSPELTEFDTAKQGEFWHSLLNKSVGSTVRICPVYIRLVLYSVASAGGGRRHSCSSRRRQTLDARRFRIFG